MPTTEDSSDTDKYEFSVLGMFFGCRMITRGGMNGKPRYIVPASLWLGRLISTGWLEEV